LLGIHKKTRVNTLIESIKKYIRVSQKLEKEILSGFKVEKLNKKELFIREGQYNVSLAFIQSGVLRCFNLKNGKDITNDFLFENTFVTDYGGLIENMPARQNFEAIENSVIQKISRDKLLALTVKFPELKTLGTKIIETLFAQSLNIQSTLKSDSPEERYITILNEKPEIIQRVPLSLVASYLGITQVHLSRIRKNLK